MLHVVGELLFNHCVLHNVFSPTWSVVSLVWKSFHFLKAKICNKNELYKSQKIWCLFLTSFLNLVAATPIKIISVLLIKKKKSNKHYQCVLTFYRNHCRIGICFLSLDLWKAWYELQMQLLLLRSLLPFFLHPSQKDGSIWLIPCCQLEQFKVHYWHSNPQHHNYFWRLCELLSITNAWIRWGQRVGKTPHWLSGHGWPPQCTQGCSIQYTGSPNLLLQYIVCINWYHLNVFFYA